MKNLLLSSESESDMALLLALAQKLGVRTRPLTDDEIEDIGLAIAMNSGKTGEWVPVEEVLKALKS